MRLNLLLAAALASTVVNANVLSRRQWQAGEPEDLTPTNDVAAPSFGGEVDSIPMDEAVAQDGTEELVDETEEETLSALSSAISVSTASASETESPSSTVASASASSTGSETVAASSATPTPESTTEKNKPEDGKSAKCSREHYEEVDGETPYEPFCNPRDGQEWTAGQKGRFYQITWDTTYFARNASVEISLHYEDPPKNGDAISIGHSPLIPSSLGMWEFMPEESALTFAANHHQNTTIRILITDTASGRGQLKGPRILLKSMHQPKVKAQHEDKPISGLAAAIAVPIVFVVAVGFALLLHFTLRRERKVGPIRIGGRRGRRHGYGSRQSRSERLKGAAGAIRLDDERTMPEPHPDWELGSVGGEPKSPFADDRAAVTPSSPDRGYHKDKRIY